MKYGKVLYDVDLYGGFHSMLENEKYKGDAILQKSFTADFLTKKRVMNNGEIQKFYVEEDHEAIIKPRI